MVEYLTAVHGAGLQSDDDDFDWSSGGDSDEGAAETAPFSHASILDSEEDSEVDDYASGFAAEGSNSSASSAEEDEQGQGEWSVGSDAAEWGADIFGEKFSATPRIASAGTSVAAPRRAGQEAAAAVRGLSNAEAARLGGGKATPEWYREPCSCRLACWDAFFLQSPVVCKEICTTIDELHAAKDPKSKASVNSGVL